MARKRLLGCSVFDAAAHRIATVFDEFESVCVSFSGGKDSSVMLHMVMDEAIRRGRRVGLLFIDWEAQYRLTIEHVAECFELYRDYIDPYWVTLPLRTTNAVSMVEPEWICWEPGKEWVREMPSGTIRDHGDLPFYNYAMTFEEFIEHFGHYYGAGTRTACFVGIRAQESLNRWRTMASEVKARYQGLAWTTGKGLDVYNIYPIYDWQTEDIWTYYGRTGKPYNHLYDRMHQAGLTLHQMRICEPYGDEQRRGLWLFHLIEPETWSRVVARVAGVNSGALYAQEAGNILGNMKISLPDGHTWQSFAMLLLGTMPQKTAEHYRNKIAVWLKWYADRGYPDGVPDYLPGDTGAEDMPSWRRVCKVLLRNDYWCKGLCFSPTKTSAYEKYQEIMKRRRAKWDII